MVNPKAELFLGGGSPGGGRMDEAIGTVDGALV